MLFNKDAALKRCGERHEKTGGIYQMFKRVMEIAYRFIKEQMPEFEGVIDVNKICI